MLGGIEHPLQRFAQVGGRPGRTIRFFVERAAQVLRFGLAKDEAGEHEVIVNTSLGKPEACLGTAFRARTCGATALGNVKSSELFALPPTKVGAAGAERRRN